MKAIEARKLFKTYNTPTIKHALDGVDLDIEAGSFFGLLGPNGAGKSSFINILSNVIPKTSGNIKIFGADIDKNFQAARRLMGIVPQEIAIDPFFTVREILEIYAGYYGIRPASRKTDYILQVLGLEDKASLTMRHLSGGMKRRLLIGKALVNSPKLLILDEPTAGVDIELRNRLWDYVKELNQQGTTIILTTHYLPEAEKLCDDIAIINHGKIIACDKKQNLLHLLEQKQLVITLNQAVETLPNFSNQLEYQCNGPQVSIKYNPKQINISDITHYFYQQNLKILDITTSEADLEDVFSYLINQNAKN